MNLAPADAGAAELLIVSQFTLFCRLQVPPSRLLKGRAA